MSARPKRTMGEGSPYEGVDYIVFVLLRELIIPVEALAKVCGLHINFGMETTIIL